MPHSDPKRRAMYKSWHWMLQRCQDPTNVRFTDYGGRGISVSERWQSFHNFYIDMFDGWFPGATIERNDNNGNYCKENCSWATKGAQQSNKRNSVFLTHEGRTMTVAAWAEEVGISRQSMHARIKAGYRGAALFAPRGPTGPAKGTVPNRSY